MIRLTTFALALMGLLAAPAFAQSSATTTVNHATTAIQQTAYGLPVWAWIAIVIVLLLLLAMSAASRGRKRRQAVIKTRIG